MDFVLNRYIAVVAQLYAIEAIHTGIAWLTHYSVTKASQGKLAKINE